MSEKNFEQLFYPRSITVVGATNTPGTVPCDIYTNIMRSGFPGPIYPVAPGKKTISGVKAYKYVKDIPHQVDLAVIVFPSSVVGLALEQCGQIGVKAAIIISAGFKETGAKGLESQNKIKAIADKHGISIVGPNCLGLINADHTVQLNASFARKMPGEGVIGFLSQSGALCTAVLDYALDKHIGFSKFVSFGNKMDINEIDLLRYLLNDDKTKTILMYLEEMSLGRELLEFLQTEDLKRKPILALKSGRTAEGSSAAASHTGSLAGSDDVCDAAFRQAGVIRANDIEEMFHQALALTYQPLPKSNRIAIVTNAGGPGVMAADASVGCGLQLARFGEETTQVLKKALPPMANIKNPVDVIGDARADRYDAALTALSKDKDTDGIVCILTPQSMTDIESIANLVCRVEKDMDKPLLTSFMGGTDVAAGINIMQERNIPHYTLPEDGCRSFMAAYKYTQILARSKSPVKAYKVDKQKARQVIDKYLQQGQSFLPEPAALRVLESYGLPTLKHQVAASADEAKAAAEKLGYPVVMKIVSPDVIHKSDVGGVKVGLKDVAAVTAAYQQIVDSVKAKHPDAQIEGILVEEMSSPGKEIIMGAKKDPGFGPVILFGTGGIYAELLKDTALRVAPLTERDAAEIIQETRSHALLTGLRGDAPSDIASVEECLGRLSQLVCDFPVISELDINPIYVHEQGKGCHLLDARILLDIPEENKN